MFLVKDKFGQTIIGSGGETRNTTDFSSVEAISNSNITLHKNPTNNPEHNYRKRHITIPSSIIKNPNDLPLEYEDDPTNLGFFNNNDFEIFCLATPHYSDTYMVYPVVYSDFVFINDIYYFEVNLTTKTKDNNRSGSIGNYDGNIDVVLFNKFHNTILNSSYKINGNHLFINDAVSTSEFDNLGEYNISIDKSIYNIFCSPIYNDLDTYLNISIKIIPSLFNYKLKAHWKDGRDGDDSGSYYTNKFNWIAIHKNIGDYIKVNNKPVIYTGEFNGNVNNDNASGMSPLFDYYEVNISDADLPNANYSVLLTPIDNYNSTYTYNLQVGDKTKDKFYVKYYMKNHVTGQNGAYGGNQPISNLDSNYDIHFQWAIFIQI